MKKLIKHEGYNNLYIVEKEYPDENKKLVRVFLSDGKFDMDIENCLKHNSIRFVEKKEFDNMVLSMLIILDSIYSSGRTAIVTNTSNTVLIPGTKYLDSEKFAVRSLFSEWVGGCASVMEMPFHVIGRKYVLSRIAEEYSKITETKEPIYCIDGHGMYYLISSDGEYCTMCNFSDIDLYSNSSDDYTKSLYAIKVKRENVELLFGDCNESKSKRTMRKVLLYKKTNELYIVENESIKGDIATIRQMLSYKTFDVNAENFNSSYVEIVGESKFYEYISKIIDVVSELGSYGNIALKNVEYGNIFIASENRKFMNDIVSEMLGGESSEFNSKESYIRISKEYILARLAQEYKYVTGDFDPLYCFNGDGMYFMVDSEDDILTLVPFSNYESYIKSGMEGSSEEVYTIKTNSNSICELSKAAIDSIDHSYNKTINTEHANTPSGEFKNDRLDDKLRWELLPMEEVEDIVRVFHYGAKKYAPDSWKNIPDGFERYRAALMRHMMAYIKGERCDPESGLHHLSQVAWNAMALLYYDKHNKGLYPIIDSEFENIGCMKEKIKNE